MCFFFFFNDTATTEIYTLSLHDALPIWLFLPFPPGNPDALAEWILVGPMALCEDRKSTRLNSSHLVISYAVFCLKKKKQHRERTPLRAHATRRRHRLVGHQPVPDTPVRE